MERLRFSPDPEVEDKPRDKCAVMGIISFKGRDIVKDTVVSLTALQHRGQDGTGIAVLSDSNKILLYKKQGLVGNIFPNQAVLVDNNLISNVAIGHNRYATAGSKGLELCLQPYLVEWEGRSLAIAHNGNIPDAILKRIRKELPDNLPLQSDTDTEILGWKIMFSRGDSWAEKTKNALSDIEGAYALTIATDSGELIGAKDRYSIRPLVVGYTDDGIILASETRGLEHHRRRVIRWEEVKGGEMIVASNGRIDKIQFAQSYKTARCIVEPIYFAFPHSKDNGFENSEIRKRMGYELALEFPMTNENTLLCGIPESGIHIADGYARALGIHADGEILLRERFLYGIRGFISESDELRRQITERKFDISDRVKGKNILLIDDSVVRSTTSKILTKAFKEKGALDITFLSGSPPFVDICDLGIDIPDKDQLIAVYKKGQHYKERPLDEIARRIGVDRIRYLSLEGLMRAIGRGREELCAHCLTHEHPIFSKVSLSTVS